MRAGTGWAMTDTDKGQFATIMLGLAANYGKSLDKIGLQFFFRMLAAYDIEAIDRAAMSIAATRKFTSMPTAADFIEHLSGGPVDDLAELEAGKVLEAIRRHGVYASVVFDDATTQAVIIQAYGGWPQLCQECGVVEPEKWFRKDFAKTWSAYKRQGIERGGILAGLFELENSAKGQMEYIPAPALVGNPAKAQAVLEAGGQRQALEGGAAPPGTVAAAMHGLAKALSA